MYNKVNSVAHRGTRKPGRPFNTTTYPWRSTPIGKSFILPGKNRVCIGQMQQKLRFEGFIYTGTPLKGIGLMVTRIA